MFHERPVFTQQLAFGSAGGPGWLTSLAPGPAGWERVEQRWTHPRGRWDVGHMDRTEAESAALLAFFYCIAKGRANGWRFRDFALGESTGLNEPLGTGTGSPQVLQLVKRYTSGAETYDRVIRKPVLGSVRIKANGTPTTAFTVDTTTGLVTITATAAAVLTATYTFDVPCRFDTDQVQMARVDLDRYSWGSIPILELRDAA